MHSFLLLLLLLYYFHHEHCERRRVRGSLTASRSDPALLPSCSGASLTRRKLIIYRNQIPEYLPPGPVAQSAIDYPPVVHPFRRIPGSVTTRLPKATTISQPKNSVNQTGPLSRAEHPLEPTLQRRGTSVLRCPMVILCKLSANKTSASNIYSINSYRRLS